MWLAGTCCYNNREEEGKLASGYEAGHAPGQCAAFMLSLFVCFPISRSTRLNITHRKSLCEEFSRNSSLSNGLASRPANRSLIPRTHIVKGKNQFPQFLHDFYIHMMVCAYTHDEFNFKNFKETPSFYPVTPTFQFRLSYHTVLPTTQPYTWLVHLLLRAAVRSAVTAPPLH